MSASPKDTIAAAAGRVDRWLIEGPAQLHSGPHAGAVAGSFDAARRARYVYPEITGYYLQWLAWRKRRGDDPSLLAAPAAAAQTWLGTWARSAPAHTRVYLGVTEDDWRNRTLFTFDIAMAVRGIGSAVAERLVPADTDAVDALNGLLETLVSRDGMFEACLASTRNELPQRWSTLRGGFLAKAAAGLLRAAESLPLPRSLHDAANATLHASLLACMQSPHDEVHPLLYAYEGVLGAPAAPGIAVHLDAIAAQFDALWREAESASHVPELRSRTTTARRVDVVAQMVRVAQLLGIALGTSDRWDVARLQAQLAAAVQADGALSFDFTHRDGANTWAALFCSQALHGMDDWTASAADPLIV
jgi:hypothetical protein